MALNAYVLAKSSRVQSVPGNEPLAVADKVKRSTATPNQVWVADFTNVSIDQSFSYMTFVIDLFVRYIVASYMKAQFLLERVLYQQRPNKQEFIHYSDKGSQYTAISYIQHLKQAGVEL